MTKDAVHNGK